MSLRRGKTSNKFLEFVSQCCCKLQRAVTRILSLHVQLNCRATNFHVASCDKGFAKSGGYFAPPSESRLVAQWLERLTGYQKVKG